MGIPVLILGASGSGKTASLRNFEPEEIGIFNVAGKPLPFRKKLPLVNNADYNLIEKVLRKANRQVYVIDDSQYLMANEFFDRAKEVGYQKFTDIGLHFRNLLQFVIRFTPDDVIVYFLHHTEEDMNGRLKAKTVGKMLADKLGIPFVIFLGEDEINAGVVAVKDMESGEQVKVSLDEAAKLIHDGLAKKNAGKVICDK